MSVTVTSAAGRTGTVVTGTEPSRLSEHARHGVGATAKVGAAGAQLAGGGPGCTWSAGSSTAAATSRVKRRERRVVSMKPNYSTSPRPVFRGLAKPDRRRQFAPA